MFRKTAALLLLLALASFPLATAEETRYAQVFDREQILSRIWGYDYFGDTRTVDTQIKRIRQKLPQENVPWGIRTIYGVGYKFEVNA